MQALDFKGADERSAAASGPRVGGIVNGCEPLEI